MHGHSTLTSQHRQIFSLVVKYQVASFMEWFLTVDIPNTRSFWKSNLEIQEKNKGNVQKMISISAQFYFAKV